MISLVIQDSVSSHKYIVTWEGIGRNVRQGDNVVTLHIRFREMEPKTFIYNRSRTSKKSLIWERKVSSLLLKVIPVRFWNGINNQV